MTAGIRKAYRHSRQPLVVLVLLAVIGLLQHAFAISVQISASAEQVCSDEFSHVLAVEWTITDASENIQVEITATMPDGSTQSSTQNTPQGNISFNLPLPGGGSVQVKVSAQEGGSSSSASAFASLVPCEESGEPESSTTDDQTTPAMGPSDITSSEEQPCEKSVDVEGSNPSSDLSVQTQMEPCNEAVDSTGAPGTSISPNDDPSVLGNPFEFSPGDSPEPEHDLIITDIEVTQGIQNLDNDMPLVRGRNTIVRVYVRDKSGLGAGGVSARLRVSLGAPEIGIPTEILGELLPSNPNQRITVRQNGGKRRNLNDSFWFLLPKSWTQHEQITLLAEVDFGDVVKETDEENNTRSVSVVLFPVKPFLIKAIPLHLHPQGDASKPTKIFAFSDPDRKFVFNGVYRYFPISELIVDEVSTILSPIHDDSTIFGLALDDEACSSSTEWNMERGFGQKCLLRAIEWFRLLTKDSLPELPFDNKYHYVGMVDPGLPIGPQGRANVGKPSAWSRMFTPGGRAAMGHELIHTQGFNHYCERSKKPPHPYLEPSFPYNEPCLLAQEDPRGYYGLEVYYGFWGDPEPKVFVPGHGIYLEGALFKEGVPPGRVHSLIASESVGWVDPFTYCKLLNIYVTNKDFRCEFAEEISEVPTAPGSTTQPTLPDDSVKLPDTFQGVESLLLVSGIISRELTTGEISNATIRSASDVDLRNIQSIVMGPETGSTRDDAPYHLEVQDNQGRPLIFQPIALGDLSVHSDEGLIEDEFPTFNTLIPFPEDASRIVLKHGETELDAHTRSLNEPQIDLLFPNGGELLQPDDVIRWEASDEDNDELTFTVLYSPDAGSSWQPIAVNLSDNSFSMDSVRIPGSQQALIRVVAHDGFNTSQATFGGTLTVPRSAPIPSILGLKDGKVFVPSDRIILEGQAQDLEDKNLQAESLVWASDLDGVLGMGQRLVVELNTLSVGQHQITLTATDSDGMSAQTTVTVIVQSEPERGPLTVQVEGTVRQACSETTDGHEMVVSWEVTGGQEPLSINLTVTGPDGTTATIPNHPVEGKRIFLMGYPEGGGVSIEMTAQDAEGLAAQATSSVTLESCAAVN